MQPVDILVLTYNRIDYLKTFIESVYLATSRPFRLIVIDNGSTDGSREFIIRMEKEGLVWKHLFIDNNLPLGAAFTEGFKLVESDLFVTVADDMTLNNLLFQKPCWLSILVAKMQSDENVGSINFHGLRCSFKSFYRKTRPGIEERIKREGGEKLEMFNKLQKIIYNI